MFVIQHYKVGFYDNVRHAEVIISRPTRMDPTLMVDGVRPNVKTKMTSQPRVA